MALAGLNCTVPENAIFGLVGANGAGKSTLLRLITGVYKPSSGRVLVDGMPLRLDAARARMVFVPDELFFLPGATLPAMAKFYAGMYRTFSMERFYMLCTDFGLPKRGSVGNWSKGQKRQAAAALALSCGAKYLFFDETFDGLDPVKRGVLKRIILQDVRERGCTAVITSHSLRELEDTCTQLALLHRGGLIFQSETGQLTRDLFKLQFSRLEPFEYNLFEGLRVLEYKRQGSVANLIIRGDQEAVMQHLRGFLPTILEALPLTLEEVCMHEMAALGYTLEGAKH